MYKFIINDKGPDLDIVITRALLALSAIATLAYRTDGGIILNWLSFLLLVTGAIFIKPLIEKLHVSKMVLLLLAALILFFATHSITFALILLMYGYLIKFLYRKSSVLINNQIIKIDKLLFSPSYKWSDFSNIILKDNLLTLDFRNNKLLQLDINEEKTDVDQEEFNAFCAAHLL